MKANQLLALSIAAAAGCGVVNPALPAGATDAGSDTGSGSGSDMGSGSDTDPPGSHPPGTIYGHIKDERGDTIDFSSGEPVHTHSGPSVDVSTGCPAVYKYAYLTSKQAPSFGSEVTLNPIAFHVQTDIASTDASASAYRVRTDDGHTLLDWTPMSPDGDGIYTMTLHRDDNEQMQLLGAAVQKMYIDARFRDTNGTEAITSGCWENHPLAAPLNIQAAAPGELFGMTYAAHSTVSRVMMAAGSTVGVGVVSIPFQQQTEEATTLLISAPSSPSGSGTRELVDDYFAYYSYAVSQLCAFSGCADAPQLTRATTTLPLAGTWQVEVIDDATGGQVCFGTPNAQCVIPPRGATEAPHAYHLIVGLAGETSIAPPVTTDGIRDMPLASQWYTGAVDDTRPLGCTSYTGSLGLIRCTQMTEFNYVHIVNQATIAFDDVTLAFSAKVGTSANDVNYAPLNATTFSGRTWTTGSAGF